MGFDSKNPVTIEKASPSGGAFGFYLKEVGLSGSIMEVLALQSTYDRDCADYHG